MVAGDYIPHGERDGETDTRTPCWLTGLHHQHRRDVCEGQSGLETGAGRWRYWYFTLQLIRRRFIHDTRPIRRFSKVT